MERLKYRFRLKARGMRMEGVLNEHARAAVSPEEYGPWEDLVDRGKRVRNPWRFIEAA